MAQAAETGGDVEGDEVIAAAAGEPRPLPVGELHLGELLEGAVDFVVHPVVLEEHADILARLAFVQRLPQPRGFLEHHAFEVLVFLERAVERGRVAPEIEDAANLGIGHGDAAGERIGVEPAEDLLGAFVRKLHEIRQRHDGVPRGLRDHLHGEALVAERVGDAGGLEFFEVELARAGIANGQRQRFGDEDAARQHGEKTFLAVAGLGGRADGFVGEETEAVGDFQAPREAAGFLGGDGEILLGAGVAERGVGGRERGCVAEREADAAGLRRVRLVRDLDGEFERVAFAQETRRVGLDHDVLGGDGVGFDESAAKLAVVREAEEAPAREGLGHGEFELHLAVFVGDELREKEGAFVEILACGDFAEVGGVAAVACAAAGAGVAAFLASLFVGRAELGAVLGEAFRGGVHGSGVHRHA